VAVRIVGIGTALPPFVYPQADVAAIMRRWVGGERRVDRMLDRVYAASGIERRYSVLPDFTGGLEPALFRGRNGDDFGRPTTGMRNERYGEAAPVLVERAARRALAAAPASVRERVTHVVTVSCTGFLAPGVDDHLVRALGLGEGTERYHLGFMGCYAAFPALRMARAFCLADPEAVVLLASVELCTLHLDPRTTADSILSTSVFADGAAAVVVTASDGAADAHRDDDGCERRGLELLASATTLTREGKADMAWTIGDHGFDMVLTSYVPKVLEAEASAAVAPLLRAGGVTLGDIDTWALHPGGRAIIDKVERALGLGPGAVAASRELLAETGNMSSASVLFVLQRLLGSRCEDLVPSAGASERGAAAGASDRGAASAGDERVVDAGGAERVADAGREPSPAPGALVVALAFGPGLTVDSALLRVIAM
jgi:predicted naringenin-chalcone synthase